MPASAGAHPADTPLGRFGVETLDDSPDRYVASIPMAGLLNPATCLPTVAPLAVLVDYVAGMVNHHRRAADEWTVSTELSIDLTPGFSGALERAPQVPVMATARPFGPKGPTSLATCEITHKQTPIAVGTVRSIHIRLPASFPAPAARKVSAARPSDLRDIMCLQVKGGDDNAVRIFQSSDPALNNTMGMINGGVAAAGLELIGSAMLNANRSSAPLDTASLHVRFLHQFFGGGRARYEATVTHAKGRSGAAESRAIGTDGKIALTGRLTAYR